MTRNTENQTFSARKILVADRHWPSFFSILNIFGLTISLSILPSLWSKIKKNSTFYSYNKLDFLSSCNFLFMGGMELFYFNLLLFYFNEYHWFWRYYSTTSTSIFLIFCWKNFLSLKYMIMSFFVVIVGLSLVSVCINVVQEKVAQLYMEILNKMLQVFILNCFEYQVIWKWISVCNPTISLPISKSSDIPFIPPNLQNLN